MLFFAVTCPSNKQHYSYYSVNWGTSAYRKKPEAQKSTKITKWSLLQYLLQLKYLE